MELTLQIFWDGSWHDAALVTLTAPQRGAKSASVLSYDKSYFMEYGAIPLSENNPVRDFRALSVAVPIDLFDTSYTTWPPLLWDFLPQGRQRERMAQHLDLPPDAPATEIHLLKRSAGSPVGNVRIKESHVLDVERMQGVARVGVSMEDILARSDDFLNVADRFGMIASGSSGLQGDWPKVALTLSKDGLWYPDPVVADDEARDHVIVKLLRSNDASDGLILAAEAGYSAVAKEFGLNVERVSTHGNGVLVIPRFDRAIVDGRVIRHGQESLVTAIGVAQNGYIGTHERYLAAIQEFSSEPLADTTEYILRDVLNLAMGNPDNHGRNTAIQKRADGSIRLSPLYDFAPMRLSPAVIMPSTKWDCMKATGEQYNPDWEVVCAAAAASGKLPVERITEALAEKEDLLRSLPEVARRHGVPEDVVTGAIVRHEALADGVAKLRKVPGYK